tara:strand:+ start:2467 stop:3276 length:810 start_codon:yes stop_codon:yes gene_type:complete
MRAFLVVIFVLAVFTMLTTALAGAWFPTALFAAISLAILPVAIPGRVIAVSRGLLLIAALVMPLLMPALFIRDAQNSMDRMWHVVETGGSQALSWNQRAAIWSGNVIMAVGGAALGYPEAALETLGLILPTEGPREWGSDFAMASPKVRMPLQRFVANLPQAAPGQVVRMTPVKLTWRHYRTDRRVALALNAPSMLHASARSDGKNWTIDCRITVPVIYPKRARVWFLNVADIDIYVEEGLFHAAQELGWLHYYRAVWHWQFGNDGLPG